MIHNAKPVTDMSRHPTGNAKHLKNFRLTPETIRRLEIASNQEGMPQAIVVELALKAWFKELQIPAKH